MNIVITAKKVINFLPFSLDRLKRWWFQIASQAGGSSQIVLISVRLVIVLNFIPGMSVIGAVGQLIVLIIQSNWTNR